MQAERSISEQLLALTRLQNLSLKLTSLRRLDETLDAILDAARTICDADHVAISYLDEAGILRMMRHYGLSDQYISRRLLTRVDPAVAGLLASKQPVVIENVDDYAGISPNYDAWKKEGIASIASLPLLSEGEVFGLIGAGSSALRRYSKTEMDSMAILAAHASAAIVNARLFEQLREANLAKDEFLATLSHELRTPLTPILGWTHLLKPFSGLDPLLSQGLSAVERNANHLAGLINDLLDLTRIATGKTELARGPADIATLLREVVAQALPQAGPRGVALDLTTPEESIIVEIDVLRIQEVLANLVDNAIKFTPAGGQVRIELRLVPGIQAASKSIAIAVTDSGIGIDPEFLPHVFEKFTQAHSGLNRRYGGLGLGLAISRTLVGMHGGNLTASSEGLGRGSTFLLRLPLHGGKHADGDEGPIAGSAEAASLEEGLGLRVLVIEDSLDTADMLQLWLGTLGCEVLAATIGEDALRLAANRKPDIILSDIGMPDLDGYELLRRLRQLPGVAQVPAIALTGYAQEGDRKLALEAGYNEHLAKPADLSRLLDLIRKLTADRL